jgi:hypothetical protein
MSTTKDLQDKKETVVINLFLKINENTVPNIAKESGLLESTVHKIINNHLKTKVVNG